MPIQRRRLMIGFAEGGNPLPVFWVHCTMTAIIAQFLAINSNTVDVVDDPGGRSQQPINPRLDPDSSGDIKFDFSTTDCFGQLLTVFKCCCFKRGRLEKLNVK
uniref:Uncharacterized protein n=1 Tax=Trichuris muris TaxID=70415 RepID=A0A5S6QCV8_TRIMR